MKLSFDIKVTTEFKGSQTNVEAYMTDESKRECGSSFSFRKIPSGSVDGCIAKMSELCAWELERKGLVFDGVLINSLAEGGQWYSSQESYLNAHRERGREMPAEMLFEWGA